MSTRAVRTVGRVASNVAARAATRANVRAARPQANVAQALHQGQAVPGIAPPPRLPEQVADGRVPRQGVPRPGPFGGIAGAVGAAAVLGAMAQRDREEVIDHKAFPGLDLVTMNTVEEQRKALWDAMLGHRGLKDRVNAVVGGRALPEVKQGELDSLPRDVRLCYEHHVQSGGVVVPSEENFDARSLELTNAFLPITPYLNLGLPGRDRGRAGLLTHLQDGLKQGGYQAGSMADVMERPLNAVMSGLNSIRVGSFAQGEIDSHWMENYGEGALRLRGSDTQRRIAARHESAYWEGPQGNLVGWALGERGRKAAFDYYSPPESTE